MEVDLCSTEQQYNSLAAYIIRMIISYNKQAVKYITIAFYILI